MLCGGGIHPWGLFLFHYTKPHHHLHLQPASVGCRLASQPASQPASQGAGFFPRNGRIAVHVLKSVCSIITIIINSTSTSQSASSDGIIQPSLAGWLADKRNGGDLQVSFFSLHGTSDRSYRLPLSSLSHVQWKRGSQLFFIFLFWLLVLMNILMSLVPPKAPGASKALRTSIASRAPRPFRASSPPRVSRRNLQCFFL